MADLDSLADFDSLADLDLLADLAAAAAATEVEEEEDPWRRTRSGDPERGRVGEVGEVEVSGRGEVGGELAKWAACRPHWLTLALSLCFRYSFSLSFSFSFFLPAAIAIRSSNGPSCCCCCWGGDIFVGPLNDLVAQSHTNNITRS